jgi:hypothetical protein
MTSPSPKQQIAAVRFEGGIGDHVLGMRVLSFLQQRYPTHRVVAYSDASGAQAQMDVLRLSPSVDEVKPVFQDPARVTMQTLGYLNNVQLEYLVEMQAADVFVDTFTEGLFLREARKLDCSFFEVLNTRPRIQVPAAAKCEAALFLRSPGQRRYVGLSLGKYGPDLLGACLPLVKNILDAILCEPNIHILNFFNRRCDFGHWPEPDRQRRERGARQEVDILSRLPSLRPDRFTNVDSAEITTVISLLQDCSYFLGVDNGIKHLAWALGVQRTWITPYRQLTPQWILRYAPDYHRMLQVGCDDSEIQHHINVLKTCCQR